jgi:superfamily II DNA/RNA helicase
MSEGKKTQSEILAKMGIEQLNPMQVKAQEVIQKSTDVVLLSPTGTGKTLAFLLPIIDRLDPKLSGIQTLILVPSRELAIQIETVFREMGTGYKANAVYGGRAGNKDKNEMKHEPAVLIGTPGRVADHLRRERWSPESIKTLVLDEFDKSLEIGFEEEMKEIMLELSSLSLKVLTSATQKVKVPDFVRLNNPTVLNYLEDGVPQLEIKLVEAGTRDKMEAIISVLSYMGNEPGIIFCNFKDTISEVSEYLDDYGISHGCFFGGMEQKDRERVLIKFRNGTHHVIVATDLAARGLDIPELKFIIHHQLPNRPDEFIHRNGRTARMNNEGTAYVLHWKAEELPKYVGKLPLADLSASHEIHPSIWSTLFISGGRKDKISKGDIAGLFLKQGKLNKDELGTIELKQDCAFVAVPKSRTHELIEELNNSRLKKKKVRITLI